MKKEMDVRGGSSSQAPPHSSFRWPSLKNDLVYLRFHKRENPLRYARDPAIPRPASCRVSQPSVQIEDIATSAARWNTTSRSAQASRRAPRIISPRSASRHPGRYGELWRGASGRFALQRSGMGQKPASEVQHYRRHSGGNELVARLSCASEKDSPSANAAGEFFFMKTFKASRLKPIMLVALSFVLLGCPDADIPIEGPTGSSPPPAPPAQIQNPSVDVAAIEENLKGLRRGMRNQEQRIEEAREHSGGHGRGRARAQGFRKISRGSRKNNRETARENR